MLSAMLSDKGITHVWPASKQLGAHLVAIAIAAATENTLLAAFLAITRMHSASKAPSAVHLLAGQRPQVVTQQPAPERIAVTAAQPSAAATACRRQWRQQEAHRPQASSARQLLRKV